MKPSNINKGTYVCAKFDEESLLRLNQLQNKLALCNPVSIDDLHSTIVYSRNYVPYQPVLENAVMYPSHLEIWNTDDSKVLVLVCNSEDLTLAHNYAKAIGASFDFPDYTPHVTLSYNINVQKLDLNQDFSFNINIVEEQIEDLDLNWTKDKK